MSKEIKEFRIVDKKFLEAIYVDDCTVTRIDLEALFGAKVVEEQNEQNCSCEGLEAFERIKWYIKEACNPFDYPDNKPHLDTIEKELKRLAKIDDLFEEIGIDENNLCVWFELQKQDGKKVNALDIIKEDFFTFIEFKEEKRETKTYYFIDFNRGDYRVYLPKEKWDTLKEVLL